VSACYRGVELKFTVQDMREEVELKMNAALKDMFSNTQGAPILKPKTMYVALCVFLHWGDGYDNFNFCAWVPPLRRSPWARRTASFT
jgi:hypothetical protein